MLVARSMHPGWLSNAYLVADEEGGAAVYVDSGAPLEPLFEAAERWNVRPSHVLRTHGDPDHVEHEGELGLPVVTGSHEAGGLSFQAIATPGHADDHLAFLVGDALFSGDVLFKDAVGGGDPDQVRDSVMRLMELPRRRASIPATPTRRRSDASGRRTPSSGSGAARSRRAPSGAASTAAKA